MKSGYSIYMPDPSGRLGSTVFSKNKYGSYQKKFTAPSQPRTIYQQNIRSLFAALTRLWGTLTDGQRQVWKDRAAENPVFKKGVSYILSAMIFFIKLNRNLQAIGEAVVTDCPRINYPGSLSTFSVDIVTTPGTEDIKLNCSPAIPTVTKVLVMATPVTKASRALQMSKMRVIGVLDHTFVSGGSIKTQFLAKYGAMPATGDKVYFAIKPVSIACGAAALEQTTVSIGAV